MLSYEFNRKLIFLVWGGCGRQRVRTILFLWFFSLILSLCPCFHNLREGEGALPHVPLCSVPLLLSRFHITFTPPYSDQYFVYWQSDTECYLCACENNWVSHTLPFLINLPRHTQSVKTWWCRYMWLTLSQIGKSFMTFFVLGLFHFFLSVLLSLKSSSWFF